MKGRMGPRSRKGAKTRARLLAAAKETFEEDGFLDARISDIAERAGLSHGSFYHYFDSKSSRASQLSHTTCSDNFSTFESHAATDDDIRGRAFVALRGAQAGKFSASSARPSAWASATVRRWSGGAPTAYRKALRAKRFRATG